MKIVGNKIDLLFLLYIQQKVFSQHKKEIASFLLEKCIGRRKAQGLIFLLESIVFEENEKEYSMLSLKQKEDDYDTNELSITEWGFVIPPIIKVNNCIVEK